MILGYILTALLLVFFMLYACLAGVKDALIYAKKGAKSFPWDEHIIYNIEKTVVGAIFFIAVLIGKYALWKSEIHFFLWCFAIGFFVFMAWSFFHNGWWAVTRKHIDKPDYSFTTTTGRYGVTFHINYRQRLKMLIVGLLFVTATSYFTLLS